MVVKQHPASALPYKWGGCYPIKNLLSTHCSRLSFFFYLTLAPAFRTAPAVVLAVILAFLLIIRKHHIGGCGDIDHSLPYDIPGCAVHDSVTIARRAFHDPRRRCAYRAGMRATSLTYITHDYSSSFMASCWNVPRMNIRLAVARCEGLYIIALIASAPAIVQRTLRRNLLVDLSVLMV